MTGQGVQQRRLHGFAVADLADHDKVRRFAQRIFQRLVIALRVDSDLPLVDDRLSMLEQVFDRIFESQDVSRAVVVAVVDHGRQRCRLARACCAGDEDEAALFHDKVQQHGRQAQFLERRHAASNVADDQRDRAALAENVDTEVANGPVQVGKIHFHLVFELAGLVLGLELVGDAPYALDIHRLGGDGRDDTVDLDVDRRAARNEQVRCLFFGHELEQSVQIHVVLPVLNRGLWRAGVRARDEPLDNVMN